MIELLFLLLPIAAAYGWYMGRRSAKKDQDDISNKLSRDYVTGVNFLLSNQTDKAVDLFLDMLQKQEIENEIESHSQFESELTLGNLFRSRGEVDRALRIHQALDLSPNYTFEQKLLAKQQLARDFMVVGFFDRAENLYILLVDEPEFAENALQQLLVIYQKTKEWKKAVNIAEKLAKINPQENNIELAQCYCEYSQSLEPESAVEKRSVLQKALSVSPTCVRASLLLANLAILDGQYQQAAKILEKVLEQNPDYTGEILLPLKHCYEELNQLDNFELFLIRAGQIINNDEVELALAKLIEEKDGKFAAQANLYQQLTKNPSTLIFHRFMQYQIDDAEDGRGKESLILLHKMVGERIKQTSPYRCTNCGYQIHKLLWNCPSCRQWESIKPVSNQEHN
ncbi:tetratricopeptide repeat protein [Haemophilus influenzae]|uniref:Lipopolysaccharide assembly protein B n=1 Tax=Haemophilus influenzae TaxID=727 RepID=A0A2S9RQ26_HAEIF|nr:lipopolysaccharide assembly protein LapB [Haemophilus influenzae]PRI45484.1 tetratricopeptide repeat protein [Haemophilus influenzae]PRJ61957.1 tetratricopeptide repeat protein [Haemophilus influenzae]PRK15750.1 tetratricopeptide repeat protein [Haemophilus influenzae]PRM43404.1 tetratricopeptide repeat protein [Haemophilus influenzae]